MMPELDGLDLCRRIRESNPGHYVYFILLTARENKQDLIEGMNAGADDFLTKPFHFEELHVRLRAAERVLDLESALAAHNEHLNQVNNELETALGHLRADLDAAAAIQASLLPKRPARIDDLDLHWLFHPAATIGGDIFNFFRPSDDYLIFYHLDVAGHGVPAAMLSVTLSRVLSDELHAGQLTIEDPGVELRIRPPEVIAADLNERFQADDESSQYFTMIYGYLDTRTGQGRFCQAGHPYPLLVRTDGNVETLGSGGFPIGMLEDVPYDSIEFDLQPGDRLLLYSDGITECHNPEEEDFGPERLAAIARACRDHPAPDLIETLDESLEQWRGQNVFEDDISLLLIGRCRASS